MGNSNHNCPVCAPGLFDKNTLTSITSCGLNDLFKVGIVSPTLNNNNTVYPASTRSQVVNLFICSILGLTTLYEQVAMFLFKRRNS